MNVHITYQEESYEHVYDHIRLKDKLRYAENDIQRLQETIAKLEEYKGNLNEHIEHVNETSFTKEVEIYRRDYSGIQYFVKLIHHPDIEKKRIGGNFIYGRFEHHEIFVGRERHKAITYAKQLADEHNCKIAVQGMKVPKQIKEYVI